MTQRRTYKIAVEVGGGGRVDEFTFEADTLDIDHRNGWIRLIAIEPDGLDRTAFEGSLARVAWLFEPALMPKVEAHLGLATTRELLTELADRGERGQVHPLYASAMRLLKSLDDTELDYKTLSAVE